MSTTKDPRKALRTAKGGELVRKYELMRREKRLKTASGREIVGFEGISGRVLSKSLSEKDCSPKFQLIGTSSSGKRTKMRLEDTAETENFPKSHHNTDSSELISQKLKVTCFNSAVIPSRKHTKSTIEDVRRFLRSRDVKRFKF